MAQFEEVLSVQAQLKKKFVQEATLLDTPPKVLVTVVQLPTGAHEVIVNHEELHTKLLYLIDTYDEEFRLRHNPKVKIIGYVLV